MIAEPSSSLVSKQDFEEFSKHFLKRIASSTSNVILHICGKSNHLLPRVLDMEIEGLSIDQNIKLEEAVSIVPNDTLVFGNYSPKNLVVEKPEGIRRNVAKMLSSVRDCRNVVSSTGFDIPAATPEENIVAFVEASKSFRRKKVNHAQASRDLNFKIRLKLIANGITIAGEQSFENIGGWGRGCRHGCRGKR